MKRSASLLWLCVAVVFAVAATILMLSYMVTNPGHVIVQLGADCGKNYYTYLYHSLYDNGVWFEGMNYPYGEHIIYADGQPMLSSLLNHFKYFSITQVLAIMNLAISLSYVLAIVFTYKILSRFGVKPFIAIVFACLINLLAPQVLRVRAHFALAYLCPVPMLFYWSLMYHYSRKWKWPVFIFIMGFIMAFIHLYIGAIIFIWVAFYSIGYMLFIKSSLRERLTHITPLLISAAGLFLVIKICISLTDPITDRPTFPLNTLETVTHIKDIVSSQYSLFWNYVTEKTGFKKVSDGGEGYTYVGLVTLVAVLLSLFAGVRILLRRQNRDRLIVSEQGFSAVWLFVAFSSLLLAMGAPFIWHMQWLLNYLSLFKQFRAMGRFSWVFYYIITIYAVVVLNAWYTRLQANGRPAMGYLVLVVAFMVWSTDISGLMKYTRGYIADGLGVCDQFFYKNEPVKWPEYLQKHGYKATDFQGIILLPFFMSGTEKLWLGGDPSYQFATGMRLGIQLHLPIVDVLMSRTSWSLTEKQVKTVAGPFADKPMLRDLKSKKPFLLIQYDGEEVNEDQQYLFKASEFLGHDYGSYVYACYPERIMENDKKYADTVNAALPFMHSEDTCMVNKGIWYVDHYDSVPSAERLFGAGAAKPILQDDSIIKTIPVRSSYENQPYEFSCWFLLDNKDYRSPYITLILLDSAGNKLTSTDALTKESVDNYGMWFRSSTYFKLRADCRYIRVELVNQPNPAYLSMDEMLLRPADAVIISRSKDGHVMVNNHRFAER